MKAVFEGLLLSLGYFSQIHFPYQIKEVSKKHYGFLALGLPLVGLVLGGITVLLYKVLSFYVDGNYGGVVSGVVYFALYGFIHLEAMADIIDAYYAKHSGKDVYAVLKDPNVGALGAIGTFSFMILKIVAIVYLLKMALFWQIVLVMILSRFMAVVLIYKSNLFHIDSKFIYKMKEGIDQKNLFLLSSMIIVVTFFINFWLLFLALLMTYFLQLFLQKNIGFLNGDGLGFVIEMVELFLFNVLILF